MKKLFLVLPLSALLFAMACEKNDDDVNAEPYIIEISEYVNYPPYKVEQNTVTTVYFTGDLFGKERIINSTNCTASELKIELPGVLSNKYLDKINEDKRFDNCSISDEKTMIGYFGFRVLMEEDFNTGLYHVFDDEDDDFHHGGIMYCYVDRDVEIVGNNEFFDAIDQNIIKRYDLELKKGWNKIALRVYRDPSRPYPQSFAPTNYYHSMDVPDNTYWRVMSPS